MGPEVREFVSKLEAVRKGSSVKFFSDLNNPLHAVASLERGRSAWVILRLYAFRLCYGTEVDNDYWATFLREYKEAYREQ